MTTFGHPFDTRHCLYKMYKQNVKNSMVDDYTSYLIYWAITAALMYWISDSFCVESYQLNQFLDDPPRVSIQYRLQSHYKEDSLVGDTLAAPCPQSLSPPNTDFDHSAPRVHKSSDSWLRFTWTNFTVTHRFSPGSFGTKAGTNRLENCPGVPSRDYSRLALSTVTADSLIILPTDKSGKGKTFLMD